jgi:hypothetical protein
MSGGGSRRIVPAIAEFGRWRYGLPLVEVRSMIVIARSELWAHTSAVRSAQLPEPLRIQMVAAIRVRGTSFAILIGIMMRTLGAAIGAVIVLLFLASMASQLTWSTSADSEVALSTASH